MSEAVQSAKRVLAANEEVLYGIFSVIGTTDVFPPREFLNRFFAGGNDPCDQDNRMGTWQPFNVSEQEYLEIKGWWVAAHPDAIEDDLSARNWADWVQKVLNP